MIYKGYDILPVYAVGSDFDFTKNGVLKNRRPRKEDLVWYSVVHRVTKEQELNQYTVEDAKEIIDRDFMPVQEKN
jgi:hypothetical protein